MLCFHFSIAKCLGARRACEEAYNWTTRHKLLSYVVQDQDAVNACLNFAGTKFTPERFFGQKFAIQKLKVPKFEYFLDMYKRENSCFIWEGVGEGVYSKL